jgi:hypothetical protein
MANYVIDHIEITWLQTTGYKGNEPSFVVAVSHPEAYIFSYDPIVADAPLTDGTASNLTLNWTNQYVPSSVISSWISPIVDLGEYWSPIAIRLLYDDRVDYHQYVDSTTEYRLSDSLPFGEPEWQVFEEKTVIDTTAQYVQIRATFISSDPELRYPVFKECRLFKGWKYTGIYPTWDVPSDDLKVDAGAFSDTTSTDFYGVKLTSSFSGTWISPVHDLGELNHADTIDWYSYTPGATTIDTVPGGSEQIQIRGSDVRPINWSDNTLPQAGDPVWDTLEWIDIERGERIFTKLGARRYIQIKVLFTGG